MKLPRSDQRISPLPEHAHGELTDKWIFRSGVSFSFAPS
jgi:hypothetical protein